jgi:hypothetical protein
MPVGPVMPVEPVMRVDSVVRVVPQAQSLPEEQFEPAYSRRCLKSQPSPPATALPARFYFSSFFLFCFLSVPTYCPDKLLA